MAPQPQHLVFDEERHDVGKAYRFLFVVGEAGDFLAFDQELAVGSPDMT